MPHPVWERHLHKRKKEREVRTTKGKKGSEIITTICEYENSVAMPDNERLTYLDTCGIARLKDGNGNASTKPSPTTAPIPNTSRKSTESRHRQSLRRR